MAKIRYPTAKVWLLMSLAIALPACAATPQGQNSGSIRVERDVAYSPPGWPEVLRGDFYRPVGQRDVPAVVMVHGGGWDGRDRSDMDSLSAGLAEHGYAVLNIDYRLAPEYRYPAAVHDVVQAAHWLVAHADRLGIDASRLGGWGYSAGAHLVAMAALGGDGPEFSAVVAGGMPSELPRYPKSPLITGFLGETYANAPTLWREASPITHVGPDSPPMFLYHGTRDRLVSFDDSAAMKQALDEAGVPAQLHPVTALGHITTFVLGWGAREDAVAFLDERLQRLRMSPEVNTTRRD